MLLLNKSNMFKYNTVEGKQYYDEEDDVEIVLEEYDANDISTSDESDIDEIINDKVYTMMCRNIIENGTCNRSKCTFAHTIEQLRPVTCKFDEKCVNKKCTFIHTKETKDDYVKRMGLDKVNIKPKMKCHVIRTSQKEAEEDMKIALYSGHKYVLMVIKDE